MKIKNCFPAGISLLFQLLPDSEIEHELAFEKLDSNPKMGPLLHSYDMDEELMKMVDNGKALLDVKPYLSDDSYKLFYTYQGLIGRVIHMLLWEFQKGKLYNWKKDNALKTILKITLTEKELDYVLKIKLAALDSLIQLIEYKILVDFQKNLNINDSTEDTVKYLREIDTLLKIK